MISIDEAREIALRECESLFDRPYETDEYWVFKCDSRGIVHAGGGDPIAVSKSDGSARILYFVLEESWDILNSMKPA